MELTTVNENAFNAFANAAAAMSGGDQKPILRFDKGNWYAGQDNSDVDQGTRLAADMMHAEWGWIHWVDNKPAERRMVVIASGAGVAARETLGNDDKQMWPVDEKGVPQDPWRKSIEIPVREIDGERREFTLAGSSKGFEGACKALFKAFGEGCRANGGKTPIIELGASKYKHQKWGMVPVPALPLVEWVTPAALAVDDAAPKTKKAVTKF